jgi:hypothetical protein
VSFATFSFRILRAAPSARNDGELFSAASDANPQPEKPP